MNRSLEQPMFSADEPVVEGQRGVDKLVPDENLDLLANVIEMRFNAIDQAFDFMGLFNVEVLANQGASRFFDQEKFAKKWLNEPDFRDSVNLLFAGFDLAMIKRFFLDYGVEKEFAKTISRVIVKNRVGERAKRAKVHQKAVKKLGKFIN